MSEYDNAVKLLESAEDRIKKIEDEMQDLRYRLNEVKGTATEVYTRIVGYYRNINNWNPGKKNEYAARKEFDGKKAVNLSKSLVRIKPAKEANKLDIAPNWMKPDWYDVNEELTEQRII